MKKDEWILTKELGRLRKYGYMLQAERVIENKSYNIVFQYSREILEPSCSVNELLGIVNALEKCLDKLSKYNKGKKYEEIK